MKLKEILEDEQYTGKSRDFIKLALKDVKEKMKQKEDLSKKEVENIINFFSHNIHSAYRTNNLKNINEMINALENVLKIHSNKLDERKIKDIKDFIKTIKTLLNKDNN